MGIHRESVLNAILMLSSLMVIGYTADRVLSERPGAAVKRDKIVDVTSSGLTVALNGPSEGANDANIVLVEFSDYQCPFCARRAQTTSDQLRKNYIDTGRVRHLFKNFPLENHPLAPGAALAAECAKASGQYWSMHRLLFQNQRNLQESDLKKYAATLGLDQGEFARCLKDVETRAVLATDLAVAARLGVAATPTFFVGLRQSDGTAKLLKQISGAQSYEIFATAIDDVSRIR